MMKFLEFGNSKLVGRLASFMIWARLFQGSGWIACAFDQIPLLIKRM